MKGKIVLALAVIISLSMPAAFSDTKISVEYVFNPAVLGNVCGTCDFRLENVNIREIPGEPVTLYKRARILLPPNTTVKTVKVKHKNPLIQKGIDVLWGQQPCSYSDTPVLVEKNEKIYCSDNKYPDTLYEFAGVHSFRGFAILYVNLFFVQYQPKSHVVHFYETLTVEVTV